MKPACLSIFFFAAVGLAAPVLAASVSAGAVAGAKDCDRPPPPPDQSGPPGDPPAGPPPGMAPCAPPGEGGAAMGTMPPPPGSNKAVDVRGEIMLASGSAVWAQREFSTRSADTSAVLVTHGASLSLEQIRVRKEGDTSSFDASSFVGMNAALLANDGATMNLRNAHILTTGSGANGVFAAGSGSNARLEQVEIRATGDNAHGVMVAGGGSMSLEEVSIETSSQRSAAIATDRGAVRSASRAANGRPRARLRRYFIPLAPSM